MERIIIYLSKSPEKCYASGSTGHDLTIYEMDDIKDTLIQIGLCIYFFMKNSQPKDKLHIHINQMILDTSKQMSWDPVYQYLCLYDIAIKVTDINQHRQSLKKRHITQQQEEEKKQAE